MPELGQERLGVDEEIERLGSAAQLVIDAVESMGWHYAKSGEASGGWFCYWKGEGPPAFGLTSCECIETVWNTIMAAGESFGSKLTDLGRIFSELARCRPGETGAPCRRKAAEEHAIIAKLHTTADGVPVPPGLRVWFEDNAGRIRSAPALRFVADGCHEILTLYGWVALNRCYSTREAAEAAAKGGDAT